MARSYRAHASTSGGGSFHCGCPTIRGAACKNAAPAPLFAAQPTKVFRRSLFSKRLEQNPRQPRGVCHGFCWRQAVRLNGYLAACGPRFL
ncbi:hypothetical protein FMM72_10060 [Anaerotruncus colihominis]|uniref:Uncharacterized protein n=1 Tax=Anaerotruncus colihominis TaxID=169435 RepID=A0A845SYK1_9FIRM|nr:hypothetical protein [Anaerotruncus colihominis]